MPPYEEPKSNTFNILKFVRVESGLFVGNNVHDRHRDIVTMNNLRERVEHLRKTAAFDVDAGFVEFNPEGIIFVYQDSDQLRLPVQKYARQAREITLKHFGEQSPNHRVSGKERF